MNHRHDAWPAEVSKHVERALEAGSDTLLGCRRAAASPQLVLQLQRPFLLHGLRFARKLAANGCQRLGQGARANLAEVHLPPDPGCLECYQH